MENKKKAYLLAILTILIWSTVASAFKISLRYINFLQLLFFSSFVSSISLFIILCLQKKLYLLKKLTRKEIQYSIFLGFLNPFIYYIILFKAYSILPAQEAITLNYTWPIMLVLLSIPILKQKIPLISLFAIIISFIGVIIIATKGNFSNLKFSNIVGDLLPLSSAIIWALFWIFNIKDKRDDIIKLFLNFSIGFLFMLILNFFYPIDILKIFTNIKGLSGAVYVGLFEMGITFVIWLNALKLSKTTAEISNLIYLTPFLSLVIVSIITGEKILISTIIGLIFIITGLIIQHYTGKPISNLNKKILNLK